MRRVDVGIYVRMRSLARSREEARWIRRFSAAGEHSAVWLGIGAAGMVASRRRARERWRRGMAAVVVAHWAAIGIKQVVGRRRPQFAQLPHLIGTPSGLSFPSAHATGSFAAAHAYTPLVGPAAGLLWPAAAAMAASRVVLGVHYPSDIVAGAALGVLVGGVARRGMEVR